MFYSIIGLIPDNQMAEDNACIGTTILGLCPGGLREEYVEERWQGKSNMIIKTKRLLDQDSNLEPSGARRNTYKRQILCI